MYTDPMLWVLPVREGHFADVETEPREVSDLFKVAQRGVGGGGGVSDSRVLPVAPMLHLKLNSGGGPKMAED